MNKQRAPNLDDNMHAIQDSFLTYDVENEMANQYTEERKECMRREQTKVTFGYINTTARKGKWKIKTLWITNVHQFQSNLTSDMYILYV